MTQETWIRIPLITPDEEKMSDKLYRLNEEAKQNIRKIETAFVDSGFEKDEARALAKMYYAALSNKTNRLANLKDDNDDE